MNGFLSPELLAKITASDDPVTLTAKEAAEVRIAAARQSAQAMGQAPNRRIRRALMRKPKRPLRK